VRKRPAPEVVASAVRFAVEPPTPPKSSAPSATLARPVPPPPTPKVPASVLVKVKVPLELVIVVEAVRPLYAVDEVASVIAPVAEEPPAVRERRPALVMVRPPEPTTAAEPEIVMPEPLETEEVAAPYTPLVPFDTRMLLEEGCEVVERPVHVTVEFDPPTSAPREEAPLKGPENASEEVATEESALVPLP